MISMIEQLKKAGLNDYQARAYLALVKYGTQAGREAAGHSGIPATRIFDVLRSLADKGLANIIQEKPMLFRAVEPKAGIKNLFESRIEILKAAEEEAVNSLKELKISEAKPKVHEKITTVLGFRKMYDFWIGKAKEAKKEIFVFSVGEEVPFSTRVSIRNAAKRGVDCRLIVTKYDEENRHILKEHIKDGWKLRHYPSTGEWTFAVLDGKIAMINVRNPKEKEERISTFFEVPGLTNALREYFEVLWKKAEAVKL